MVRVIDQGCGIPKEKQHRLGEPFYSTKEKGTGMGLMTCYKIIEQHQGKINISSEEGLGTTVEIMLPLQTRNEKVKQIVRITRPIVVFSDKIKQQLHKCMDNKGFKWKKLQLLDERYYKMGISRSTLTKRYLIVSLVISIFALSLVYMITTHVVNESIMGEVEERNQLMVHSLTTKSENRLEQVVSDIHSISPIVLAESERRKEDYEEEMKNLVLKNPIYLDIVAFDENRDILASIPEMGTPSMNEMKKVVDRLSWSKTYYFSDLMILESGEPTISISFPTINDEGEFKGGIIAFLNLNTLSNYLNQVKIGEEGMNALVDREGKIIAHSDEHFIGLDIGEYEIYHLLNKQRSGVWKGFLFDKRMLLAYKPVNQAGFGMIAGESVEQASIPVIELQKVLMKSFAIVLVITIISTMISTKKVVRPINNIIQQVKEYKQRKRSGFQLVRTNDELQELSMTLHDMAQELIDTERSLSNILESIPYAVITTDKYGKVVTFNKSAEQLTGKTREEAKGTSIFDFPIRDPNEKTFTWKTLLEGTELHDLEAQITDKEDHRHDVRVYSAWFADEFKNRIGTLLILRDVSEIKKLEDYLKQSERLASLGQLTTGIAHEIKNPLSIIQIAAETIKLEADDKDVIKELSEDILETTERLNSLLTEFLNMSKNETGAQKEKVNLVKVMDELLSMLRKKLDEQNIEILPHYTECKEAYVYANESKLGQVFLNVILNSLQAMKSGGKLGIYIRDKDSDWEIEIKDTGEGIPQSKLNWIFNPFYTSKEEGTGLGLSIAYEIIAQNKGSMRADSMVEKGTSMFISLPKYEKEGEYTDEIDPPR